MSTKETDTVRTVDGPSPEDKAWDLSRFIKSEGGSKSGEGLDEKAQKAQERAKRKAEEAEEAEHAAELEEAAQMVAPILFAAGSQATNRITPELPYTYDEALSLTRAIVNVGDKYSDGWLADYKEEVAVVLVGLSQIVPRYMMWKASQPVNLTVIQPAATPPIS